MKTLHFEDFLDDIEAVAIKYGVNLTTVDWLGCAMLNVSPGDGQVGEISWCFDSELNVED